MVLTKGKLKKKVILKKKGHHKGQNAPKNQIQGQVFILNK